MSLKSSFLKFKNISAVKRVDVAQKVKAEKLSRQSRQPICQGSNAVKQSTEDINKKIVYQFLKFPLLTIISVVNFYNPIPIKITVHQDTQIKSV